MRNKHDSADKDKNPTTPRTDSANPDTSEHDDQPRKGHAGEDEMERRNQSIQDGSLGAPATGSPGTPKAARK